MYINLERFSYSSGKRRRQRRRRILIAVAAVVLIAGGLAFFFSVNRPAVTRVSGAVEAAEVSMAELWRQGLYTEVSAVAESRLEADPSDWQALVYSGFAAYYRAYYEKALEDKLPLLNKAVEELRRALLNPQVAPRAQISAVLGQAYYYKGKFYYDLAIRYLEAAVREGYVPQGVYEYLGLAYGALGDTESELAYFQKAAQDDPSDLLLLSMGKALLKLERRQEAEENLLRALNKTDDPDIEKESRFRLADLYKSRGDLIKAEEHYRAIMALDPDSAEAHFQLGELYLAMNDPVRARAEWRKTLVLDPTHYGARRRYYD